MPQTVERFVEVAIVAFGPPVLSDVVPDGCIAVPAHPLQLEAERAFGEFLYSSPHEVGARLAAG